MSKSEGPPQGLTDGGVVGVVLAGGTGTRFGLSMPKQLVRLGGVTILERSVAVLDASPEIDDIIVMMNADYIDAVRDRLAERHSKLRGVYAGGASRNETTNRVVALLEGEDRKLILHDAVRPFLDLRIVRECVAALDDWDAVDVAIPSADTIIEVDDEDFIVGMPRRDTLRRGQTPQAFRLEVLRRAYELADNDPAFQATDDCGVVHAYLPDVLIKVVMGSEQNIKVTHQSDLLVARALLAQRVAVTPREPHALDGISVAVLDSVPDRDHVVRELRALGAGREAGARTPVQAVVIGVDGENRRDLVRDLVRELDGALSMVDRTDGAAIVGVVDVPTEVERYVVAAVDAVLRSWVENRGGSGAGLSAAVVATSAGAWCSDLIAALARPTAGTGADSTATGSQPHESLSGSDEPDGGASA